MSRELLGRGVTAWEVGLSWKKRHENYPICILIKVPLGLGRGDPVERSSHGGLGVLAALSEELWGGDEAKSTRHLALKDIP
jgi:hypothetical protein